MDNQVSLLLIVKYYETYVSVKELAYTHKPHKLKKRVKANRKQSGLRVYRKKERVKTKRNQAQAEER